MTMRLAVSTTAWALQHIARQMVLGQQLLHRRQRHGGVAVDRAKFAHGRESSGVGPAVYRGAGPLVAGKPDKTASMIRRPARA